MKIESLQGEKIYYTIGEVANMFNVKTSLIRFWENEFDIIKPHRNKKGNRLFTKLDVDNFHTIYHLIKEQGYTIQGAKDKLNANRSVTMQKSDVIISLKKIKDFLLEIKDNIGKEN